MLMTDGIMQSHRGPSQSKPLIYFFKKYFQNVGIVECHLSLSNAPYLNSQEMVTFIELHINV